MQTDANRKHRRFTILIFAPSSPTSNSILCNSLHCFDSIVFSFHPNTMTRRSTPFSLEVVAVIVMIAVDFIVLYTTTGSQLISLLYFMYNLSLSFFKNSYCYFFWFAFSFGLIVELLFVYFLLLLYFVEFCFHSRLKWAKKNLLYRIRYTYKIEMCND